MKKEMLEMKLYKQEKRLRLIVWVLRIIALVSILGIPTVSLTCKDQKVVVITVFICLVLWGLGLILLQVLRKRLEKQLEEYAP